MLGPLLRLRVSLQAALFVIDLASRRVQIVGSTPFPDEMFMRQIGRTLTAADDNESLPRHSVLISDSDRKWSGPVRQLLADGGIRIVQTPVQAPNANAHAERFVRSIKSECLDRVILLGERHLRQTIREFMGHYHRERNHQGLGNELIETVPMMDGDGRRIQRRSRLGGLLNYYVRAA
jgi:putative transposase